MVVLRHKLADRGHDLYETPPEATLALLAAEPLPSIIWEPACGRGAIVRVLRANGHVIYATDLVDYDTSDQDQSGWDFLMETQLPIGVQAIVTNPPYKIAGDFIRNGLKLGVPIYCLLRLTFLESAGRSDILDYHLPRVYVFRNRLPMMDRDGWEGPKSTSSVPFAWFVFTPEVVRETVLHRISWKPLGGGI